MNTVDLPGGPAPADIRLECWLASDRNRGRHPIGIPGRHHRNLQTAKARAKATIRYLLHRPGKEGTRTTRTLFGADGVMSKQQAYRMINATKNGTTFFRLVISPDPAREDRGRDLHLPEITSHTLLQLEERLKNPCTLSLPNTMTTLPTGMSTPSSSSRGD